MSGLVDRVRSTIRNRSRSRSRGSISDSRRSLDARTTEPLPNNGVTSSEKYNYSDRDSLPQSQRTVDDMSAQARDANRQTSRGNNSTGISSPRNDLNDGDDAIPERVSSLRPRSASNVKPQRRPVTDTYNDPTRSPRTDGAFDQNDGMPSSRASPNTRDGALVGHKTSRSVDVAAQDPSSLVPRTKGNTSQARKPVGGTGGSSITTSSKMEQISSGMEHLRLPPDFDISNSEITHVETAWQPAVTRQEIRPVRTEIVQKAIQRDVHVHHYFTYVQPIRVVEILPARHFRIDEVTGVKSEISAPEGFVMPQHLTPHVPDINGIIGDERHYLVDEKHPGGVLEPPSANSNDMERLSQGQAESMRTGSMGTGSMGTGSMGTASMGTASKGTASMGTGSMGTGARSTGIGATGARTATTNRAGL